MAQLPRLLAIGLYQEYEQRVLDDAVAIAILSPLPDLSFAFVEVGTTSAWGVEAAV